MNSLKSAALAALLGVCAVAQAQKYQGVVDKSVAVVGNEMVSLSDLESEVQMMRAQGFGSDRNIRCELLESMMESKLFLMQARIDSLNVNSEMVSAEYFRSFSISSFTVPCCCSSLIMLHKAGHSFILLSSFSCSSALISFRRCFLINSASSLMFLCLPIF